MKPIISVWTTLHLMMFIVEIQVRILIKLRTQLLQRFSQGLHQVIVQTKKFFYFIQLPNEDLSQKTSVYFKFDPEFKPQF